MSDRPEPDDPIGGDDLLAAEYVLGVQDAETRESLDARMRRDADFAAAVAGWSKRLAPLDAAFTAVKPPSDALAGIEARLFADHARDGIIRRLWASAGLWRGAALAASLALAVVLGADLTQAPAPTLIGAITAPDGSRSFVARFDPDTGNLTIRQSGGPPAPDDRSFEAWVIPADGTPRSLGLVPAIAPASAAANHSLIAPGVTLAISVEPLGGSPSGAPTGPVVAVGTAIAL
ncbi:MAG: anti-sigma factor [Rhodobacteraceae bacterium]|nr:anti-sigma factor [Paracoccaceae bacterium]